MLLCVINLCSGEKSETLTAALYQVNDVTSLSILSVEGSFVGD